MDRFNINSDPDFYGLGKFGKIGYKIDWQIVLFVFLSETVTFSNSNTFINLENYEPENLQLSII